MKYKVLIIAIITIIIFLGLLIGSPINNNANIVNVMINIIGIVYILLFKYNRKKEKLFKNKIDIFVFLLCIFSLLPVISGKYISLNDSINYCIKYFSCLILYFIIYDLCSMNKNTVKHINIAVVLTILIIITFSIDILTTNVFTNFLNAIDSIIIDQGETRLSSTFGYGNTFAAVVGFGLILNLGLILQSNNNKSKFLFACFSFIYMASFILSYSRIVYIVFIIVILLYLIVLKDKKQRLRILEILLVSGIYGVLYSKIFMDILNSGTYIYVWYILITFSILCGISIFIINKLENIIKKVPIKKMIYVIVAIAIIGIFFIIYALNMKTDLILFNTNNTQEVVRYIYNVSYKEECVFEFDINSNANGIEDLFEIEILEKNKYFDDIKSTTEKFGDYNGTKKVIVKLDENVQQIYIYFRTRGVNEGQFLNIKSLKINNEEIIINHKYLPTNLVTKITSISFKHKSAWERLVFIEDAFKVIKDNWLVGIGGNGWEYTQGLVQDYNYYANEVHCYPVQIFLEYGIFAFVSFISIVAIIIFNFIKKLLKRSQNEIEYITIFASSMIIFMHSLVDFDMTFMFVMYIMFIYLGMIRTIIIEDELKCGIPKLNNYAKFTIPVILITFMCCINTNKFIAEQIDYPKIKDSNIAFADKIEILNKCERNVPYDYTYKMKKLQYLDINKDIEEEKRVEIALEEIKIIKYMIKHEKYYSQAYLYKELANNTLEAVNEENIDSLINNLYLAYYGFKENSVQQKYSQYAYIQRVKNIKQISDKIKEKYSKIQDERLKELADNFNKINIDEYYNTIKILENYVDCRVTKQESEDNIKKVNEYINVEVKND